MPVSKISIEVSWSSKLGAGRWIGYIFSALIGPLPSMGSPSRLKMRPRPVSPTGTVIGAPVSSAVMPRTRPSVELIAMQRTTLSPRCSAASTVRWMFRFSSSILIALRSRGSLSGSNSTSTVGPITCTTFPAFMRWSFLVSSGPAPSPARS